MPLRIKHGKAQRKTKGTASVLGERQTLKVV